MSSLEYSLARGVEQSYRALQYKCPRSRSRKDCHDPTAKEAKAAQGVSYQSGDVMPRKWRIDALHVCGTQATNVLIEPCQRHNPEEESFGLMGAKLHCDRTPQTSRTAGTLVPQFVLALIMLEYSKIPKVRLDHRMSVRREHRCRLGS